MILGAGGLRDRGKWAKTPTLPTPRGICSLGASPNGMPGLTASQQDVLQGCRCLVSEGSMCFRHNPCTHEAAGAQNHGLFRTAFQVPAGKLAICLFRHPFQAVPSWTKPERVGEAASTLLVSYQHLESHFKQNLQLRSLLTWAAPKDGLEDCR